MGKKFNGEEIVVLKTMEIELSEKQKLVITEEELGGEIRVDVRHFVVSEKYTGATQKGINISKDKLGELIEKLISLMPEAGK